MPAKVSETKLDFELNGETSLITSPVFHKQAGLFFAKCFLPLRQGWNMASKNAESFSPDQTEAVVPRSLAPTKKDFVDVQEGEPIR